MVDVRKMGSDGFYSVSNAFERLHPELSAPRYYMPSRASAEEEPLEYVAVYDSPEALHFLSLGFSDLYEKEGEDPVYSGFGFELTLLLKKSCLLNEELEKLCIVSILQSLARETFDRGELFAPWECIYSGQTEGMDVLGSSLLTGFVTAAETPELVLTDNGRVDLVRLVGMTDAELCAILEERRTVKGLLELLGHNRTEYDRESLL